jgi:hypothetical protein
MWHCSPREKMAHAQYTGNWQGVFREFSAAELRSLIQNSYGIQPQRGCIQACTGCHASAFPIVTTADWNETQVLMHALRDASAALGVRLQERCGSAAMVETFRDSDPAHLHYATGQGIGDFTKLIYDTIGAQSKLMTSGARYANMGELQINMRDLSQLALASNYCGRMSTSISIQTGQYRKLGPAKDAILLAKTFEALLHGERPDAQMYMDMMCFTDAENPGYLPLCENRNTHTLATIDLFKKTLAAIDTSYIDAHGKEYLLDQLHSPELDCRQNHRIHLPGRHVGFRTSPYLSIGRAVRDEEGQAVQETQVTDWLQVLEGDPSDRIMLYGRGYKFDVTRRELSANPGLLSELVAGLKQVCAEGLLAERAILDGDWCSFFRTEIDLSKRHSRTLSSRIIATAPGINLDATINLLISDSFAGELQNVIPFKRLHLGDE